MPRPPVSRPARTRPTKATNTSTAPAPKSVPETLRQDSAPSSDIYDVSDREKERAATRRKSLRDGTSLRHSRTTSAETIQQQKALDKAKQRRDDAMERLENITSTASSGENEDEIITSTNDSLDASQGVVKATPPRRRPTDITGLDLDDSMFDDLDTTLETVGHASAQRSAETSTISVSQFRRRPRAGSFLSRDDGPIRPGSRTGQNTPAFSSTLNFGQFKRRAREPSILSSALKPRPQRPEPEQEPEEDEEEEDDLDDDGFAPEAESTPLRRSKRGSGAEALAQSSSSAKSRKRKSTEGHERRLRSSPFEVQDEIRQSIEQPASDDDSPLSSPPSLPQHAPSTPIAPPMDPELMAPPLSSSSSASDEELWPPIQSIPKARTRKATSVLRRTPVQDDNMSDMSSPPSLTHSPNYAHSSSPPPARAAKTKRKAAPKPAKKMTTADLAALLPRRRRRGTGDDPFNIDEDESEPEVDISGLGARDDELGNLDVRMRRRPAARANVQNKATRRTRAPTRNKDKTAPEPNKRISRTYGRLSDKENQNEDEEGEENDENEEGDGDRDENESNSIANLDEESSQMLEERLGKELKTAVRKFQEVDQWELSFEERTRSSSPVDAR
ncbi:hypothetical protein NPX13_g8886 [Xylaria arbuscula]|uniref:Uncharacterized protein n=1 Tax=Xylaria arbuscula TaxID=114810 RepID=A0A9W8TI01_9PEZI|nr:hypothetical protein NPX13_g8886 [Xylaria arbuscula]